MLGRSGTGLSAFIVRASVRPSVPLAFFRFSDSIFAPFVGFRSACHGLSVCLTHLGLTRCGHHNRRVAHIGRGGNLFNCSRGLYWALGCLFVTFEGRGFSCSYPPPRSICSRIVSAAVISSIRIPSIMFIPGSRCAGSLPGLSSCGLDSLLRTNIPLSPIGPGVLNSSRSGLGGVISSIVGGAPASSSIPSGRGGCSGLWVLRLYL